MLLLDGHTLADLTNQWLSRKASDLRLFIDNVYPNDMCDLRVEINCGSSSDAQTLSVSDSSSWYVGV